MEYRMNGEVKTLGDFGKSTQREFDEALAALPVLVKQARTGDEESGTIANALLWGLANESVNTRTATAFNTLHQFGNANDTSDETLKLKVLEWRDDENGEGEYVIETMEAVSEYHAKALLRDRIKYGKYPKGTWLEYILNGETIVLDIKGRIE